MEKLYELEKEVIKCFGLFVKNQKVLERELEDNYTSDYSISLTIELLKFNMNDYLLSKKLYEREALKLEKLNKSEVIEMEKWAIEWVIDHKLYGAILTDINQVSKTEQEFKKKGIVTKTTYYDLGVK